MASCLTSIFGPGSAKAFQIQNKVPQAYLVGVSCLACSGLGLLRDRIFPFVQLQSISYTKDRLFEIAVDPDRCVVRFVQLHGSYVHRGRGRCCEERAASGRRHRWQPVLPSRLRLRYPGR